MNLLKQCQQITISDSNSPENSLENVEYIEYYTPNSKTFEMLDEDAKKTYPSDELLDKCEIFLNLPDDILRFYTEEWTRITGA